jgi:hypothetical protein
MSPPKPQQRRLTIRGRVYHFVSYQGSRGNPQRAQLPYPAMWYLMVEGRRCPVLPCAPELCGNSLDAALSAWVDDNALGPVESAHRVQVGPARPTENWWGPN